MTRTKPRKRIDTASRVIDASGERLYRAFQEASALMRWLPPKGMSGRALEYDFTVGGQYRIELKYGAQTRGLGKTSKRTDITEGRFVELAPGKRIKQTVEFESDDQEFAGQMMMTWSFEQAAGGTLVTVAAENVPSGISKEDHNAGLQSSLENLTRFVTRAE